ncbi:UDP-N-acetylmuramoyl-L-alanyl-D-glutamate--2,6-diaminopimelate ligase [Methylococcus sp. EFPC2]|uniref:UDP-N-acetylmuramoyl-L-alanyl-D-glutamate--2, 6-diaminopimelate ligase n=1 Tax=Methylococcus sp. EFPC2 TaxID=2812648 RepID=UPI00196744FF|nr:UDP-N-acetylmuramoyl-L-alanyl-D-glutamate--2,6-diaminopimelate ligase [Methylococcus sp. EFPC2]QSA95931.1 UDP-N-acetylmuramoyl-L-alanyl-D-glutamate--2,6-diaminopimelate ligase [Methylococcus sp. EFPC2]
MSPGRDQASVITLDRLLAGIADGQAAPALPVGGLCHDSRALKAGDVFCALAGTRVHGMAHAAQALAAGASAVLYDPAQGGRGLAWGIDAVPCVPVEFLDQRLGLLAGRFYGEPSHLLEAIAVTGTNGKTSCSHFLADALAAEHTSAVIGTLGWGRPGALRATRHTTPDAIEIHALLARLHAEGVDSVIMEASSHGLVQGRLNGVRFRGALFTNLSRDHLDFHGNMEAYLEAKLKLVEWPGLEYLAFNLDDASAGSILARAPNALRKIGFGLSVEHRAADEVLSAEDVSHEPIGLSFRARFAGRSVEVQAPVYGDYNVQNLLGAMAVLLGRGLTLDEAALRLARVRPVPGRMERFQQGNSPAVVVDYAHTPDALEKTLSGLRRHSPGRLWVVFGCGGDRDRGKRPQMGYIAARGADRVIVTDDNPRYEDGDAIVAEILAGAAGEETEVAVMRDRHLAIQAAIEEAQAGDIVLVAGKGHEIYQEIAGVKYPFSDREVVEESLRARGEASCA